MFETEVVLTLIDVFLAFDLLLFHGLSLVCPLEILCRYLRFQPACECS